jgi:hypothetical protein
MSVGESAKKAVAAAATFLSFACCAMTPATEADCCD